MAKEERFEQFLVVKSKKNRYQIRNQDGTTREVEIAFARDRVTNEISVNVIRHFNNGDEEQWFEGSEPWGDSERHENLEKENKK